MGVFDDITVAPSKPATGVFTAVPQAPAKSGSIFANVNTTPAQPLAAPPHMAGYFEGKEPSGSFIGISEEKDPYSGRPYLAYRVPGATATTTDKTRVAPKNNPEVAAAQPRDAFTNPRMPESASHAVRKEEGATPDEQLDHSMALALGGSNAPANLKLVPTEQNQAASQGEGTMSTAISQGALSLFTAQNEEAKAKGLPVPWTDQDVKRANIFDSIKDAPANSLLGTIKNTIMGLPNAATTVGQAIGSGLGTIAKNIAAQYTNPSPDEQNLESHVPAGPLRLIETPVLRTIEPMVEPLVHNAAAALIFNQPELYQDFVQAQKSGTTGQQQEVIAATQKTPLQVIGDTAQAVLGAYFPEVFGDSLAAFSAKGLGPAILTTATHGAAAGFAFGTAQAASSGSTDPKELAAIVFQNTVGGALLSLATAGATHGIIRGAEPVIAAIKERLPKSLAEAQRGFVRIPGLGDLPEPGDESKGQMKDINQGHEAVTEAAPMQEDMTPRGSTEPQKIPEEPLANSDIQETPIAPTSHETPGIPVKTMSLTKGRAKPEPRSGTMADFSDLLKQTKQSGLPLSRFLAKANAVYDAHDPETRSLLVDVYKHMFQGKTPVTDAEVAQATHIFDIQSKARTYAQGEKAAGSGLSKDTLANAGAFYAQMGELKKADPERSMNEMNHISRFDIEGAMQRAQEAEAKIYARNKAIADARSKLPDAKRGVVERLKDKLYPIARLPKETKDVAMTWRHSLLQAVEEGNKEMAGAPKELDVHMPPDEAIKEYTAIQHGRFSPARAIFDKLFDYAEKRGLEVPYRKNYLPQVYREPLAEVKASLVQYMRDMGVDEAAAEAYVEGVMQLTPDTAVRLKVSPSFEEAKAFPTYGVAAKYGLTPKFTNMKELIGNYRYELERSIANKDFVRQLVDSAKLLPGDLAPKSWVHVTTNFVHGDLYAEPKLADLINGLYEEPTLFAQVVKPLAWLNHTWQKLMLSGAVPYTNIHFWSIGNLIKAWTAGRFQDTIPFIRSNSLQADARWFKENQAYADMAARQGIDLGGRMGSIKQIFTEASHDNTFMHTLGVQFDKAFTDKSFAVFMPELYLNTFKGAHVRAMEQGASGPEAEKFAGDVTRNFFGMLGTEGRSMGVKNALQDVFFAPQFREGVLGVLVNTAKSVTTEIGNPTFYLNRRLAAGIFVSFGLYQLANKLFTGMYMWQNPNGHQFDLMIPLPDGNNIFLPFMPSFMTLPRSFASAGIATAKGDFSTAEQQIGNLFGASIQTTLQVLANKNYFGNAIYKPTDSGAVKSQKIAEYVGLENSHPYIKAVADLVQKHIPLYQALSEATTLPFKFSTDTSIAQSAFYNSKDSAAQTNADMTAHIAPIYDRVQQLAAEGDKAGAQKLVDGLTDEEYKSYVNYKRAQAVKQTTKNESQEYAEYQQVQGLVQENKTDEAKKIIEGMSDEQYKAYMLLKKRFGGVSQ